MDVSFLGVVGGREGERQPVVMAIAVIDRSIDRDHRPVLVAGSEAPAAPATTKALGRRM